jgi:hypothetical protein
LCHHQYWTPYKIHFHLLKMIKHLLHKYMINFYKLTPIGNFPYTFVQWFTNIFKFSNA